MEVELLMYYCRALSTSGISFRKNTALNNLYQGQLKKIAKVIGTLHEDLQYDYLREMERLN